MKKVILAIFIALSNLAYSQIELLVPPNSDDFTLTREDEKKYSIEFQALDSLKKYTIVAKDTHAEFGKEYTVTNKKVFKIDDSLELKKDKPIVISVKTKNASDEIQSISNWTITLKNKDLSYKESVKAIMDSINKEGNKSRIVGHLRIFKQKEGMTVSLKDKDNIKLQKKDSLELQNIINIELKKKNITDLNEIKSINIHKRDSLKKSKTTNRKFKPDSIELKIRRGSVNDIRVFGKMNGEKVVFGRENRSIDIFKVNDESQKSLSKIKNKRYLKLLYPKQDTPHYLKLSEILGYDYVMGKKFFPKDTVIPMIKLNSKSIGEKIPLYKDVHLNSYLEGRLYTDVIGLNGEEANGVAQAEIKAHFNLNTQSNFAFVEPSLHYSKFTKDNDFVVLDSVQSNALTNFHRQSFLSVGLKLNIIKREFGDRYDLELLNIGSQYSWTRLKDITSTTDITNTVHLFNSFFEIKGKMNEFHNFGISLGNKFLYELPVQDQNLDLNPFSWYIIPELEIFYYPVENKNNTVYLRFTYTSNTRNHDFDYPSLQFGYKFRIKLKQK